MAANATNFRILFVCTGGICRSLFSEIFTRYLLREMLGVANAARFVVASAGTDAIPGAPMHPFCRAELARWGLATRADGSCARLLDASTVARSDLVLTAERRQRGEVVKLSPLALRSTFCLRELVRLLKNADSRALPDDPVDRAKSMVVAARRLRGTTPYVAPEEDTIPDPIALGPTGHRIAARMIADSLQQVISLISSGEIGADCV